MNSYLCVAEKNSGEPQILKKYDIHITVKQWQRVSNAISQNILHLGKKRMFLLIKDILKKKNSLHIVWITIHSIANIKYIIIIRNKVISIEE